MFKPTPFLGSLCVHFCLPTIPFIYYYSDLPLLFPPQAIKKKRRRRKRHAHGSGVQHRPPAHPPAGWRPAADPDPQAAAGSGSLEQDRNRWRQDPGQWRILGLGSGLSSFSPSLCHASCICLFPMPALCSLPLPGHACHLPTRLPASSACHHLFSSNMHMPGSLLLLLLCSLTPHISHSSHLFPLLLPL